MPDIAVVYALIAAVTVAVVYVVSRRWSDRRKPGTNRFGLSVLAGIFWPLLVLAAAQVSAVMTFRRATHGR